MREMLFIVEENSVRSYLSRADIHKSTELDGMCLRVLRGPAYVFEGLFLSRLVGCGKPNAQSAMK